jgi:hypothetical protein
MALTFALEELTDEAIDLLAAQASARGMAAVYPPFIAKALSEAGNRSVSGSVSYKEVNASADDRDTVVIGLRAAIKRNKVAAGRMFVLRTPDNEDKLTIAIRKAASAK